MIMTSISSYWNELLLNSAFLMSTKATQVVSICGRSSDSILQNSWHSGSTSYLLNLCLSACRVYVRVTICLFYKRIYQRGYNGKRWLWHQFHLIGMNYCWIKHILLCHQEVGRLKEWQLVSVTTEIVSMYFYEIYPVFQYLWFLMPKFQVYNSWKLDGKNLCTTRSTTHLGLERSDKQESEINIEERIKTSRRTMYSLMSSGLHDTVL
jgi:hypothetical protein